MVQCHFRKGAVPEHLVAPSAVSRTRRMACRLTLLYTLWYAIWIHDLCLYARYFPTICLQNRDCQEVVEPYFLCFDPVPHCLFSLFIFSFRRVFVIYSAAETWTVNTNIIISKPKALHNLKFHGKVFL